MRKRQNILKLGKSFSNNQAMALKSVKIIFMICSFFHRLEASNIQNEIRPVVAHMDVYKLTSTTTDRVLPAFQHGQLRWVGMPSDWLAGTRRNIRTGKTIGWQWTAGTQWMWPAGLLLNCPRHQRVQHWDCRDWLWHTEAVGWRTLLSDQLPELQLIWMELEDERKMNNFVQQWDQNFVNKLNFL